jgi:hypothetical protein
MADDYERQNVTTWRLRELLQHEQDNRALRTINAELLSALKTARGVLEVACGTEAPYIREAFKLIDPAIAKAEGR